MSIDRLHKLIYQHRLVQGLRHLDVYLGLVCDEQIDNGHNSTEEVGLKQNWACLVLPHLYDRVATCSETDAILDKLFHLFNQFHRSCLELLILAWRIRAHAQEQLV